MSHIGEYRSVPGSAAVAPPLLMECDRQGKVIWLSAAARLAFGEAANLADAVRSRTQGRARAAEVRFFVVLETGDRMLISAHLADLADRARHAEGVELVNLQNNLVRHCFRLQHAERNLSARARQMRPGCGSRTVVQMERERQRLGRELHTGVGQMLVAIRSQLEIIVSLLPEPPHPIEVALLHISTLLYGALEQVRMVSRKLHPPEWLRLTLEDALRQLWEISGLPQRYEASLHLVALPHEPDLYVKILMYRAAQEALSNLTQHSRATHIEMALELEGERLSLRVRDNGVGFDAGAHLSAPARVGAGIGLRSVREQATSLGGSLAVESGAAGTTLVVSAPFGS